MNTENSNCRTSKTVCPLRIISQWNTEFTSTIIERRCGLSRTGSREVRGETSRKTTSRTAWLSRADSMIGQGVKVTGSNRKQQQKMVGSTCRVGVQGVRRGGEYILKKIRKQERIEQKTCKLEMYIMSWEQEVVLTGVTGSGVSRVVVLEQTCNCPSVLQTSTTQHTYKIHN